MNFFSALFANPVLPVACLTALAASIVGGVIGTYVVVKRIVSISGSIAHSVLGGFGLSIWIQYHFNLPKFSPTYGAVISAILLALLIGWIHLNYKEREDALIAIIWSVGMSTGIIFMSKIPGANSELLNFLLGNLLWASWSDIYLLLGLDLFICLIVFIFRHRFLGLCFDEEFSSLRMKSVSGLYLLLLSLIALSIVLLIYVMGVILVISILTLPCSIAGRFMFRISSIMILSVILNMMLSLGGIITAYYFNWPTGAAIAIFSAAAYLICLFIKKPHNCPGCSKEFPKELL
ncbi:metal ABC transporter permease [Candidatus Clavichlamydia salmonicola]|uniref:metal ABC transporter permease n=1 Tax=Candidatus Clavichlamydia salmonicola TaxID=469812 RepID=UPI001891C83F|nr:metal ABC transporter permease [Candidatus Clavichlamydia salmonicola]